MGVAGTEDELQQQTTEDERQGGDERIRRPIGRAGDEDQEDLQEQDQPTNETLEIEEQGEPQDGQPGDTIEGGETEGEEEVVVQLGEEEPPASEEAKAPGWVKDLRQRQRELVKRNQELEAQLRAGQPVQRGKPELLKKPKLADYDYDEEKYEQARDAYEARQREVDAWEQQQQNARNAQAKRQQEVDEHYAKTAKDLGVKNFKEAEDEVATALDQVQQAILKAGASNPGAAVYALGTHPKRLQELASIKDPVKFAVAVGKLETEVKVTKRTSTKPAPETPLRGSSTAKAGTATLERLQAEADRTGDRTKVAAYIRSQRQAAK